MADERVEIQIHVDGKNAVDTLAKIEDYVNKLNGKKVDIGVNAGGSRGSGGRSGYPGSELSRLGESLWNRELLADQKRVARMEAERTKNARASYENWWKTTLAEQERREKTLEKYKTDSAVLRQRISAEQIRKEEAWEKEQASNVQQAIANQRAAWANYYNRQAVMTEAVWGTAGRAISGLGNVSNYTSTFASGIGSAFSGMGSMFNMDLLGTAQRYLTAMATRMVTGNIGASIQRADIMNTFVPYMLLAGVDETTATNALNRINQSILGLPIGLDEAAQRLRRYQMFMGDTEAATNMTIGIQNAIMAGGASEQMKTTAYYQIDRLLSAGKLSTSRQWLALLQGLGVSTRFLAQEMGNAGMTAKEMAAGLTSGEISTEDFLQAIQRLATNKDITKALEVYKNTYESWISNIGFAFKRGNANALNALSESLVTSTGASTLGYMKLFRDSVNNAYTGAVNWLGNNPSAVGGVVGSAQNFAGAVGGINFGGMASSILGNIGRVVDYVASGINKVSGGKLEDFVSFATTLAAPIGGVFKAVSGGLPAMLGVFDRFKDFNFEGLMDNITEAVGSMSGLVSGALGLIDDDTMSKLLSYGLVYGRPVGALLGAIGGGVGTIGGLIGSYNRGIASLYTGNPGASAFGSWMYGKGFTSAEDFKDWLGATSGTVAGTLGMVALPIALGLGGAWLQNKSNKNLYNYAYGNMYGSSDFSGIQDVVTSASSFNQVMSNAITARSDTYKSLSDIESIQEAIAQNESDMAAAYAVGNQLVEKRTYLLGEQSKAQEDIDKYTDEYGHVIPGFETEYGVAMDRYHQVSDNLHDVNAELKNTSNNISVLRQEGFKLNNVYAVTVEKTEAVQKAIESGIPTLETAAEYTTKLAEANAAAYEANAQWIESTFGGMGRVELPSASYFDPMYGDKSVRLDIQTTTKSVNELSDAMSTIYGFLEGRPGTAEERKNLATYLKDMLKTGDMGKILGFARLINTGDYENLWGVVNDWTEQGEAKETLKTTKDDLTDIVIATEEGAEKLLYFNEHAGELTESLAGMNIELSDAGGATEQYSSKLEQVNATLGGTAGAATDAAGSLESAAGAADSAGNAATNASPKMDALSGSIGQVGGAAGAAAGNVAALAAAIDALHDKHVVVEVETRTYGNSGVGSVFNNPLLNGNKEILQSRGGMIYAANGMFIPHGTDTVPAMLTPGEYVVRRKAAAAFGKAFMDRVNALDIHGAFRALSHRMNVPSTGSFIANNQRTYDNHASVTQNIVTNSQSFTHRRARRWVRALT